jgi:hypothetical protein
MKSFLLVLSIAIVLLINSSVSKADETSHQQAVEAFLESINIQQTLTDILDKLVNLEVKKDPKLSPYEDVLRRFLTKHIAGESLIDEIAVLYKEQFDEKELIDITNFYKTSAGQKLINKFPILIQKRAILVQKKVQENIPELYLMIEEEKYRLNNKKSSTQ